MMLVESYIHYITTNSVERYSGIRTELKRPGQQSTKVRSIRKVIGEGKKQKFEQGKMAGKNSCREKPKETKSCRRRVAFMLSNQSYYNSAKLQTKVLKTVVLLTNFPVFCHPIPFIYATVFVLNLILLSTLRPQL